MTDLYTVCTKKLESSPFPPKCQLSKTPERKRKVTLPTERRNIENSYQKKNAFDFSEMEIGNPESLRKIKMNPIVTYGLSTRNADL